MYDFTTLVQSIGNFLHGQFSPGVATALEWTLVILVYLALYAILGLVLVYVERRVCAFFQLERVLTR